MLGKLLSPRLFVVRLLMIVLLAMLGGLAWVLASWSFPRRSDWRPFRRARVDPRGPGGCAADRIHAMAASVLWT